MVLNRLWRKFRTALRPLPRPGLVLTEDNLTPGDTSWMGDFCDCPAELGTAPEKHRGPTQKAGRFRDVDVPACPRWRPWRPGPDRPNPDAKLFRLHALTAEMLEAAQKRSQPRACDCTGAPHAEEADCPDAKALIPHHVQMAMEAARLSRFASASGERRAPPAGTLPGGYVTTAATCGVAVMRPEASVVIRSFLPPPHSEYRRPAPTPVPGGGTKRHE